MSSADKESRKPEIVKAVIGILVFILAGIYVITYQQEHFKNTAVKTSPAKPAAIPRPKFSINLNRQVDANYAAQYGLQVQFLDSYDPLAPCPEVMKNFSGSIKTSGVSADSLTLTLAQNVKPGGQKKQPGKNTVCPAIYAVPYTKQYLLDKAWLAKGSPIKTINIEDKKYVLHVDKTDYLLIIAGPEAKLNTPYLPDGLASLSTNTGCYNTAQLKKYAKNNGIQQAETLYPEIDQKLTENTVDVSNPHIAVVAGTKVKSLGGHNIQAANCQVVAGKL